MITKYYTRENITAKHSNKRQKYDHEKYLNEQATTAVNAFMTSILKRRAKNAYSFFETIENERSNDSTDLHLKKYLDRIWLRLHEEILFLQKNFTREEDNEIWFRYALKVMDGYKSIWKKFDEEQNNAQRNKKYDEGVCFELITEEKMRTNPYKTLFNLYKGWKFKFVDDTLVFYKWVHKTSLVRFQEALHYEFRQYVNDKNNTAISMTLLMFNTAMTLQESQTNLMIDGIEKLIQNGEFFICKKTTCDNKASEMYLTDEKHYNQEAAIHNMFLRNVMSNFNKVVRNTHIEDAIDQVNNEGINITPSEEQKNALDNILKHRFSMISACGGTGKTDVILRMGTKIFTNCGCPNTFCKKTNCE
jgi:hypothetical protein